MGLVHSFIASDQNIDLKIGPIIGSVYTEHATGNPSDELKAGKSKARLLLTIMRKLLIWKIFGKGSPNPFFHEDGKPIVEPSLVSRNEI
ncbi:hypothetical protein D9981_01070 [Pseudoalteromonas phenolica O-BC30]|nr:hypothetical protein D9981_01070 [Pseudoalteromonas phenolica O-BC30]